MRQLTQLMSQNTELMTQLEEANSSLASSQELCTDLEVRMRQAPTMPVANAAKVFIWKTSHHIPTARYRMRDVVMKHLRQQLMENPLAFPPIMQQSMKQRLSN